SVHVHQVGAPPRGEEDGRTADRAERTYRAVHSPNQDPARATPELARTRARRGPAHGRPSARSSMRRAEVSTQVKIGVSSAVYRLASVERRSLTRSRNSPGA